MRYFKYIVLILLFVILFSCTAEEIKTKDNFEGVWANYVEPWKIQDYLIIQKIEDSHLIIEIGIDGHGGDIVSKGIGKIKKSDNILEVDLRGNKYTIKWDKDDKGEWLEMYIDPNVEEYPIYERIETFTLDKF